MAVALDHVWICCAAGAPEADVLARAGLAEGSPNRHAGQGTANRRFFFVNAYLELLWVSDAEEAQRQPARRIRLWERWCGRQSTACPFGIVLAPHPDGPLAEPPFPTWSYHPAYLPADLAIEVGVGTPLTEPELFYLPFARDRRSVRPEPVEHGIPIHRVTGVRIGLPGPAVRSAAARAVEAAGVVFSPADRYIMTLSFDEERRGEQVDLRPDLPLVLRW